MNKRRHIYHLKLSLFLLLWGGASLLPLLGQDGGTGAEESGEQETLSVEETGSEGAIPEDPDSRILCFDLINFTDGGANSDLGDFFADSISIELESQGFNMVPEEEAAALVAAREAGALLDKEQLLAMVKEARAGAVIQGIYRVEEGTIFLAIKAYDRQTGRIAVGVSERGPAGLDIYDTIDRVAMKMSEAVSREFAPLKATAVTVEKEEVVVQERVVEEFVDLGGETLKIALLSEDEGATLDLGNYYKAGYIQEGKYEFLCKVNTTLKVKIRKAGYSPRTYTFQVKPGKEEYPLPPLRPLPDQGKIGLLWTLQKPFGLTYEQILPFIPGTLELPLRIGVYALPQYYGQEDDFFGGGLWSLNIPLEAGISWHFWQSPAGRWRLAAGAGLFLDSFIMPGAAALDSHVWLPLGGLYSELQQEFRLGGRLFFYIREQYKTPGILGLPPVTRQGYGQFLIHTGVEWLL